MAVAYSKGMPLNTQAPGFSLPATDGGVYSLESFAGASILVVVFTCNHCPYAVASEDILIDLQNRYSPRGVQFVAINPNDAGAYPEDSFENMKLRSAEKGLPYPYLFDETQEIARLYDAACTPDIFVFDSLRRLRYNGRINDNWQHPERVVSRDLERALEDILAGNDVSFEAVPSMGCSIKWKSQ